MHAAWRLNTALGNAKAGPSSMPHFRPLWEAGHTPLAPRRAWLGLPTAKCECRCEENHGDLPKRSIPRVWRPPSFVQHRRTAASVLPHCPSPRLGVAGWGKVQLQLVKGAGVVLHFYIQIALRWRLWKMKAMSKSFSCCTWRSWTLSWPWLPVFDI